MRIVRINKRKIRSIDTMIVKITPKGKPIDAIRWESNEPDVREFVGNDKNLRFMDRGLEVYNKQTRTWENCPMFAFICKGNSGELFVLTADQVNTGYETVNE
jgi:hypothetical protein